MIQEGALRYALCTMRANRLLVICRTRSSPFEKSRRGGFMNAGGAERTLFHQQVPASNTKFPAGSSGR